MSDIQVGIIRAIGGLGFLLFGMKMVSTGLEQVAGNRLQSILKRATSNRFFAVIAGILATIAINSSTATTIIVVGFVNSGLMTLAQSIGVIMGSNVGTTFSAQLIAFRIDAYAPIFIFLGVVAYLFFKNRNIKNIGYVILGFGVLLFSITLMSDSLRVFRAQPEFLNMLTRFENPFLALLVGFVFTAIVQSSTATSTILVGLHVASALDGVPPPISFEASAFIILGTNIGTSITTVLASIPANRDSKRAALFHITYDIIGCIVFGTLLFLFPQILTWFQNTWTETARQVAMFHTLYNVAVLLLLLPFIKWITIMLQKIIPMKESEIKKTYDRKLIYLDTINVQTPTLAVINAKLEICRMGKMANENLSLSLEAFFEKNSDKINKVFENEKTIDYLNESIASKLVTISSMSLSRADAEKVGEMFNLISNIERIGDHAENIAEYATAMKDDNLKFTDAANDELKTLSDLTIKIINQALHAYDRRDKSLLPQIDTLEEEVDDLSVQYVKNHIERLKTVDCDPINGVIFTDMISDLERSADHARNIAFAILSETTKKK